MYGWNLEPNWTGKETGGVRGFGREAASPALSASAADLDEAVVQAGGVQEGAGLPGRLQDGQHDLAPQLPVKADDLLDVAEQLGGLRLRQQAALLQVDQPAQEELRGGKEDGQRAVFFFPSSSSSPPHVPLRQ